MRYIYKATAMESLRKWFYKPKRDDRSLLAQFFYADETLNMVAAELDSFDGREDPDRCSTLVNQLRHAQEHVLNITGQIMDQLLGSERVARGFRVKFPEDVLQDNLAGQLWFGAECLAAGSSIMNREEESAAMRPLAKALTHSLETVRALLREHCLRCNQYGASLISCCTDMLHESLKIFDRLFAEFELCYVSAMVPVKSPREFEVQQHICVLFSETLQRARRIGLLTQDQVDDYDPALMFAIPRLAIVSGLLIYSSGPLSIDKAPDQMSDMFRPFRTLLHKIRQLLWTLDRRELYLLEKLLCTNEDIANIRSSVNVSNMDGLNVDSDCYPDISEFVTRFYSDNAHCKDIMLVHMVGCEWGAKSGRASQLSTSQEHQRSSNEKDADNLPPSAVNVSEIIKFIDNTTGEDVDLLEDTGGIGTEDQVNLDTGDAGREKDFHCRTDDIIRLSVLAADEDQVQNPIAKDREMGTIHENLSVSLDISERRNSNRSLTSSRKSSRNESISSNHASEFMVRNLSGNGLSMFDPLAAASTSSVNINPIHSDNNILIPDQDLISNLSDQVSEIADKLSHITYGELPENSIDNVRNFSLMDSSISNLLQDQVSGQMYSFSSNDVSNLGSRASDSEFQISRNNISYSPSRSDKLVNMPSTSNGYLIPNAISQEPAILSTLTTNNTDLFEEDMFLNPLNNPMIISQQSINLTNMENELFGDSISMANANLSSLLLTNEEFQNAFLTQNNVEESLQEDANYYSVADETLTPDTVDEYTAGKKAAQERAKFLVGYESDSNEPTPGDSGICTENTSLDRSPDSEIKDINNSKCNTSSKNQNTIAQTTENNLDIDNLNIDGTYESFIDQNYTLSNDNNQRLNNEDKSTVETPSSQFCSSLSSNDKGNIDMTAYDNGRPDEISSYINYSENAVNVQKNEAGSSQGIMQRPEFVQSTSKTVSPSDISSVSETETRTCDKNLCSNNKNLSAATLATADSSDVQSNVDVIRTSGDSSSVKADQCDNNLSDNLSVNVNASDAASVETADKTDRTLNDDANAVPSSSNGGGVLNQRKLKKSSSPKNKKKGARSRGSSREFRVWSPGRLVLENTRARNEQRTPMKLNLEQLVDDGGGGGSGEWYSSQSSATSSFHSECADDEEIALALQAQELASRHHTRAKFTSSEDLIHRLFVCIAGVADQLQTNFASDLRNILKSVFLMNQTPEIEPEKPSEEQQAATATADGQTPAKNNTEGELIEYQASESEVLINGDSFDSIYSAEEVYADNSPTSRRSRQSSTNAEGVINSNEVSGPSIQDSQRSMVIDNDSDSATSMGKRKQTSRSSSNTSSDSNRNVNETNYDTESINSNSQTEKRQVSEENRVNSRAKLRNSNSSTEGRSSDRSGRFQPTTVGGGVERAPEWVPDIAAPDCMRCGCHFTAFRRRHHCRNCGKVFCASCSSNSIPLPRFGQLKPVRVCEECHQVLSKQACAAAASSNPSPVATSQPPLSAARRQNVSYR